MLTVKAAGVGTATSAMATITVEAYDGANAAKTSSFDVVVVTSNNPPSFTGVDPIDDLVDKLAVPDSPASAAVNNKLYMSAETIKREFKATINPGSTTAVKEELTLRAFVGTGEVVSVSAPVLVGVNTYSVDIKAMKPSADDSPAPATAGSDAPGATPVTIFATDSFGAESEVFTFDVVVNRPPSVGQPFLDVVLYRLAGDGAAPEARNWTPSVADATPDVMYTLAYYFDDLDLGGDTTCTFSTSPSQPTGRIADSMTPSTFDADLAKATSHATVNNGAATPADLMMEDLTTLEDTDTAVVLVDAAVDISGDDDAVGPGALGPFTLTVTCSDLDARVSSSAQITVRADDGDPSN